MDSKELCPICGEGHVQSHVEQVESEYKGQKAMVPMHYQVCDTCTSDFAGAKEGKLNKRAIMAFRKSIDGLLTGAEVLALRKRYRLTQDQAARLFGGGPVAFSKYENDDVAHSEAMDSLLRLVRGFEPAFWKLVDDKGLSDELKPSKSADHVATVGTSTTNVIVMANFRDSGFSPSNRTSVKYPAEAKKWK